MKKEIQFEQIENIVPEKMAEECYTKSESLSFGKRLIASIFFAGSLQGIYWFGYFLVADSKFLDKNNEYQFVTSVWWIVLLFCIYFSFNMLVLGGMYRKRKNILLAYKSNVWLVELGVVFYLFILIDLQLLTENRYLRLLNLIVVSVCFLYSIFKSIKKSKNITKKNQDLDRFTKFTTENKKLIKSILGILFIISMIFNIFSNNTPDQNLEGKILVSLIPALPILFGFFSIYAFPWLFTSVTRLYFLNKFSENFRRKFNVNKKLWYGSKSKEYKEEQTQK